MPETLLSLIEIKSMAEKPRSLDLEKVLWASETAQRVKVLADKPGDLSSRPEPPW